jgi:hypothetical protein
MAGDTEQVDQVELFRNYTHSKNEKAYWDDQFAKDELALVEYMRSKNRKSGKAFGKKFTVVQGERPVINESGLKKSLGARLWKTVTVQKLDRKKLDAAMESGKIDPVLVVQNSTVVAAKAYIRTSEYVEEE